MGCVISQDELIPRRAEWKRYGQRVVFASGVFDVLHPGHVRLLEQARSHGDILVVGIESDEKSPGQNCTTTNTRAITPACERAEIIASLAAVDFAVEFNPASLPSFLAQLAPDVIIKGARPASQPADQRNAESTSTSSQLIHIPVEPGHSTARLIERIKNLNA